MLSINLDVSTYVDELEAANRNTCRESVNIAIDTQYSVAKRAAHLRRSLSGDRTDFEFDDVTLLLRFLRDESEVLQRLAISLCSGRTSTDIRKELWRLYEQNCHNSYSAILQLVSSGDTEALSLSMGSFDRLTEDEKAQTIATMGLTRNPAALPFLEQRLRDSPARIKHSVALAIARCGGDSAVELLTSYIRDCSKEEKLPLVCELAVRNSVVGILELREFLCDQHFPESALCQGLLVSGIVQNVTLDWRKYLSDWITERLRDLGSERS